MSQNKDELEVKLQKKSDEIVHHLQSLKKGFGLGVNLKESFSKPGVWAGLGATLLSLVAGWYLTSREEEKPSQARTLLAKNPTKKTNTQQDDLINKAMKSGKNVIIYQPQPEREDIYAPLKQMGAIFVAELLQMGTARLAEKLRGSNPKEQDSLQDSTD